MAYDFPRVGLALDVHVVNALRHTRKTVSDR
jgi:hypothetical protein